MSKYLYIEGDLNDADYIGRLRETDDAQLERLRPVFEALKHPKPGCSRYGDVYIPNPYGEEGAATFEGIEPELVEEFMEMIPVETQSGDPVYCISELRVLTDLETII